MQVKFSGALVEMEARSRVFGTTLKGIFEGIRLYNTGVNIMTGLNNGMQSMKGSLLAVSYTHLDVYKRQVVNRAESVLPTVLDQSTDTEKFLEMIGLILASDIKDYATALDHPPDHPFTIDQMCIRDRIAYAAIIRAQQIMYVKDRNDKTIERIGQKKGKISGEERCV